MKIKHITIAPIKTPMKCSLMTCNDPAEWSGVKVYEDKSVWINYSCNAHLMANFKNLKESANLHRRYWDSQGND